MIKKTLAIAIILLTFSCEPIQSEPDTWDTLTIKFNNKTGVSLGEPSEDINGNYVWHQNGCGYISIYNPVTDTYGPIHIDPSIGCV